MREDKKAPTKAHATDGRQLRGVRNHEAITQALYELIRVKNLLPSVEEVAQRAGVGRRTVFRQFKDLDSLYRSLYQRLQDDIMSRIPQTPASGCLEVDLRAFVARRARVFEYIAPFRRVGALVGHQSMLVREQNEMLLRALRMVLETFFRPYLSDGAANTIEALDGLLSFEMWDRLRGPQKLGVKRAQSVLTEAAIAITKVAGLGHKFEL